MIIVVNDGQHISVQVPSAFQASITHDYVTVLDAQGQEIVSLQRSKLTVGASRFRDNGAPMQWSETLMAKYAMKFHPDVAAAIDDGSIPLTNAMLLAHVPIERQPILLDIAKRGNQMALNEAINDLATESGK